LVKEMIEPLRAMLKDALFLIATMTKPITALGRATVREVTERPSNCIGLPGRDIPFLA
jgi:hypothetical protein